MRRTGDYYCEGNGRKLAKKLPVSVPSHSALMRPAAEKLKARLEAIHFRQPTIPVISNVDAVIYQHPEDIVHGLIRQLYSPVRWVETIQAIAQQGVNIILESGPGKVLSGLNKRIVADATVLSLNQDSNVQEALQIWERTKPHRRIRCNLKEKQF